jgi:hypothetical protein
MSKLAWEPWHKVVKLRDDLRGDGMSLAAFAANLYAVVAETARPVYQDPKEFFALTYPTYNLRELAKDVVLRLVGKSEKAVRQLELTYGGGKTHTLLALYHLVREPKRLPNLPAVDEFKSHIGVPLPQARVVVMAFDYLDAETGQTIKDPDGKEKRLKYPWSLLAWQLASDEGLKILGMKGAKEREEPPATNVIEELLDVPLKDGQSVLILLDEVLMWARTKIGSDPVWRHRVLDFFQCLTQAVVKKDRCAIVASLLATDPNKSDQLGKEITQELYAVFQREREQSVQPVLKEDVAEVLRRRFFTPDSIRDREKFRPHVTAALKGIIAVDEETKKKAKDAEEEFLKSYPFNPHLTEVLYQKWTNLESFQRTRGVLRTFALALRDAEKWDTAPLVGTNVFLAAPGKTGLSEAARELTTVAATEEYEGKRLSWSAILEGELAKAREVQEEFTGLTGREAEQAVFATFLHSQPIGNKALTRELLLLLGATRPDRIELEKALKQWAEKSWFLDEACLGGAELAADGLRELPKTWRLGGRPNLRQMHHDACEHIQPELLDAKLLNEIQRTKKLAEGATAAGARVHLMPDRPADVEDDGEFHYVVLGPRGASESGKPSAEAKRFLQETTGSDKPRVYQNALVLAAPSRDGLDLARNRIKEYLAWEEVQNQLKNQELDPIRSEMLSANLESARKKIPEAIQQAYCIVVTVSAEKEIHAFKIVVSGEPLFTLVKNDPRSRIQDTAVSAEALLPGGPYELWHAGETARRVKDLAGAFAQFPHLPKMLRRKEIFDTLIQGGRDGLFVFRVTRPDRSQRVFWRQAPSDTDLKDASLEVVLPESATLTELPADQLPPNILPGLWSGAELTVKALREYFAGGRVVQVKKTNYEEPYTIPGVPPNVVESAVSAAVRDGKLWLVAGAASLLGEEIPAGVLTDDARLLPPPLPIPPSELLPGAIPQAWAKSPTTALSLCQALSAKFGKNLPWATVRTTIDGALRARMLERAPASAAWPCAYDAAKGVLLEIAKAGVAPPPIPPQPPPPPPPGVLVAEADLRPNQIQDLADQVADMSKAAVKHKLRFHVRIELEGSPAADKGVVAKLNELLKGVNGELRLK